MDGGGVFRSAVPEPRPGLTPLFGDDGALREYSEFCHPIRGVILEGAW
jgi:hypothetical protein